MASVALQHVGSSQNRDQTCVSCIGRWILNQCTIREAPELFLVQTFFEGLLSSGDSWKGWLCVICFSSCLSYVLVLSLFYKWGNEEQRLSSLPKVTRKEKKEMKTGFQPRQLTLKTKPGNACLGKASCPRLRALSRSLVRNVWDRTSGQRALPSSSCWPGRFCKRRGGCRGASSLPPEAEPAEGAASWLHQEVLVLHFWAGLRQFSTGT